MVEKRVELGFLIYLLVVLGFGGVLLFGLAAYLSWEIATRRHRPSWSNRTRRAKVMIALSGLLFAFLLFIPLRMIWVTRANAIPGSYTSDGVWGTATLTMHPDGTFVETWRFRSEYSGTPEGQGATWGMWRDGGRDWLTRNIDLKPFKGLAEYDRDHLPSVHSANVMGYGGVTLMEIDAGSDIVFRK